MGWGSGGIGVGGGVELAGVSIQSNFGFTCAEISVVQSIKTNASCDWKMLASKQYCIGQISRREIWSGNIVERIQCLSVCP